MKRLIGFALIAVSAAACDGKQGTSTQAEYGGSGQETIAAPTKDNVGDLEQAVMIEAAIADKSQGANVEASSLVDPTGRMNMFTVDVAPPFPEELWLDIKIRSRRPFAENPGVLRIAIKDGEHVLDRFGTVIGKSVTPTVSKRTINALAARDSIPATMLLTINIEALLMPEGTDPDTIDPMTAEVPEERYSFAVPTPPIRINFTGAEEKPADSPAKTPNQSTPEEGGDSTAPAAETP